MDVNEVTFLNHCRLSAAATGKKISVISVFVILFSVLIVAGGLFLLYYSSTLPEDMPHYLDNILGLLGIGLILVAASLIPIVVRMRRVVHIGNELKVNPDITPIRSFIRSNYDFWHFLTTWLIVLFVLVVLFALVLYIYLLPTLSTI